MTTKPRARKFRIPGRAAPTRPGPGPDTAALAEEQEPSHDAGPPRPRRVPRPYTPAPWDEPATRAPQDSYQDEAPDGVRGDAWQPDRPRQPIQTSDRADPVQGATSQAGTARDDGARDDGAQDDATEDAALTGRQLRMARRLAQRHGIEVASDLEAVHALRARGIDPFQRANMLQLVVRDPKTEPEAKPANTAGLPQTRPAQEPGLPSTETASPAERRAAEILAMRRDMARRRRRRVLLLLSRLTAFVLLPTFIAGYYFYVIATPMYATKSEFLILKAESGGGGGMGSMFSGTQFATNQDAIAVQSYLLSKDAMLRLDRDVGFKAHFTQDWIDPLQRLDPDPSNEEAYKTYGRNIEIGYDPTEGVIKMEIAAADPETATAFSRALLSYAEERVDNLSARKRSNAVADAEQGLREAEDARREAQERLVRMQQEGAIIDPEGRITALRGQINNIEIQLQEKQLQLQALQDNLRPNEARVAGVEGDVRRLERLLDELNAEMTTATLGEDSLAEKAVQIKLAEADLSSRDLMLQTALERLEQASRDADSQARYLTTSVEPVQPQDPSYPRSFENTLLSFLIFGGIYLMISLTASILREQVTS